MQGNIACFLSCADFFSKFTLKKKHLSGIPLECQTGWIQIKLDQMTLADRVCADLESFVSGGPILTVFFYF